jgi:hypothetical protein
MDNMMIIIMMMMMIGMIYLIQHVDDRGIYTLLYYCIVV